MIGSAGVTPPTGESTAKRERRGESWLRIVTSVGLTILFNPWIGCSKIHEGCTNCYAEADQDHFRGRVKWGPSGTRSRTSDAYWRNPLKWNRDAQNAGERKRVFCASLADVFEDWQGEIQIGKEKDTLRKCPCGWRGTLPIFVPQFAKRSNIYGCPSCDADADTLLVTMNDLRRDLFDLIDQTPWLDWQLLTKRPENVRRLWPEMKVPSGDNYRISRPHGMFKLDVIRKNVQLGTSISLQKHADEQIPALLECRDLAPVLFVSAEPLLGPISLEVPWDGEPTMPTVQVDWVIVGGESGPKRRPMELAWMQSIVDQCDAAEVACFVKQDAGPKPGMQGRIPLDVWERKEFPTAV